MTDDFADKLEEAMKEVPKPPLFQESRPERIFTRPPQDVIAEPTRGSSTAIQQARSAPGKYNGGAMEEHFKASTALQSIAQQISRLTYHEMMSLARNLHADSNSVGKNAAEVAELLHAWATRELEGKNNNSNEHSSASA